MRAYRVVPTQAERLVLTATPEPVPLPNQALIAVKAVSLNRGEVRMALTGNRSWYPGWDLAGVVERAAADGSGPAEGARVVGLVKNGAWAEKVAVATDLLATLPENVSFAQAATLPVAGLTALHALGKRGSLLARKVLVTGASGGVGEFALQLARLSGADVTAHLRRPEHIAFVQKAGADHIALGESVGEAAKPFGPFDLIVESVGAQTLGEAMTLLAERGICVSIGVSAGAQTTFDSNAYYSIGGNSLYGMFLFDELKWVETGSLGLTRLAQLVAEGKLVPQISVEAPFAELPAVAQQLQERAFPGKAVVLL